MAMDIVEPSVKAYRLAIAQRHYFMRLAVVPLIIKIVCVSILSAYGWEMDFIKRAFVMLPSYFADGWLLAHIVRLIYFGHTWPFRPTGNTERDMITLAERARGVMAGMLTFVLIRYFADGLLGLGRNYAMVAEGENVEAPVETSALSLFMAMLLFAGMVWCFRLLWLYIPASLNRSIKQFMRDINQFVFSFYMIGIWLLCMVPCFVIMAMLTSVILGDSLDTASGLAITIFNVMRAIGDTLVAILVTAGIAYGFLPYLSDKHRIQSD